MDPATGKLELMNQADSGGAGPCHVAVDRKGRQVFVANYGGGSARVFQIEGSGALGEAGPVRQHAGSSVNPQRQTAPHAHQVAIDPANRRALICDLGLDKVMVYRVSSSRPELEPNSPAFAPVAAGAGPRHLAFHPSGRWVYVINELNSTVTVFSYNRRSGVLRELQSISTLPAGFTGATSCAAIQAHPSGKFVYGSNRGHDSLAVFQVEPGTGRLTAAGHVSTGGKTPRHFSIDPTGKWVLALNQGTDDVHVFSVDPKTGMLRATGQAQKVGAPVCAVFVPIRE
jgi:6-phosphogluconolactonase